MKTFLYKVFVTDIHSTACWMWFLIGMYSTIIESGFIIVAFPMMLTFFITSTIVDEIRKLKEEKKDV